MSTQADGSERAIVIGEDVWIGANSVILKGVTIGRGAIVAAGSVLTKEVGEFEIWGGSPARKLRDRPSPEQANRPDGRSAELSVPMLMGATAPRFDCATSMRSEPRAHAAFGAMPR